MYRKSEIRWTGLTLSEWHQPHHNPRPSSHRYCLAQGRVVGSSGWEVSVGEQSGATVMEEEEAMVTSFCTDY